MTDEERWPDERWKRYEAAARPYFRVDRDARVLVIKEALACVAVHGDRILAELAAQDAAEEMADV